MDHVKIVVKNATHRYTRARTHRRKFFMLRANPAQKHLGCRNMLRYPTRMDSQLWRIFRACDGQARVIHGKINQNADRRLQHSPHAY